MRSKFAKDGFEPFCKKIIGFREIINVVKHVVVLCVAMIIKVIWSEVPLLSDYDESNLVGFFAIRMNAKKICKCFG